MLLCLLGVPFITILQTIQVSDFDNGVAMSASAAPASTAASASSSSTASSSAASSSSAAASAAYAPDFAPLRAYAASLLPQLTPADLTQCRRHREATPLSHCVHLSNPATGSTSLATAFLHLQPLQNLTFPNDVTRRRTEIFNSGAGKAGFDLMQTHAFDVASLQSYLQRKRLPKATCFVISLRDPASRLLSAFRDSFVHGERLINSLGRNRTNRTAAFIVEKLRHPYDYPEWLMPVATPPPGTSAADVTAPRMMRNASGTAFLYANSAGRPRWMYNWHYPGPLGGSMFMTSQLSYLRGIDCSRTEVHFLCQEKYDADWRELLRIFAADASAGRVWHAHNRSQLRHQQSSRGPKSRTRVLEELAIERSHLGADEMAFIRREVYPWDTALHGWACGGAPGGGVRRERERSDWRFVDAVGMADEAFLSEGDGRGAAAASAATNAPADGLRGPRAHPAREALKEISELREAQLISSVESETFKARVTDAFLES